MSIKFYARDALLDSRDDAVAQPRGAPGGLFPFCVREAKRLRQADDARDVLCAGSLFALLPAAHYQRLERRPALDVEGARALRPAEFMRGQTKQVDPKLADVHAQSADRLHRVRMKINPTSETRGAVGNRRRNPRDRLNRADFVVGEHHARERSALRYRVSDLFGGDFAHLVHRKIRHVEPELLQLVAGMENGVMLYGGGDDMVADVPQRHRHALYGGVVGLRAARSERQLADTAAERARDDLARGVHRPPAALGQLVDAGRVAEGVGEVRRHSPRHFRAHGRSRRVVHIYEPSVGTHPASPFLAQFRSCPLL